MILSLLILVIALAAPSDTAPKFTAYSTSEERPEGKLVQLSTDGAVIEVEKENRTVRDLISLRRKGTPLPPLPRGPALLTASGDRIPGELIGGDDESIRFQPTLGTEAWTVPLTAAAVLWLTRPPADTPADPARYSWLPPGRNRDIIRFRNGDTAAGAIEGFTPEKEELRFKPEAGELRLVRFTELSAIAFNPTLARARQPKGPYYRLVLRNGSRISAGALTADKTTFKARILFGQAVELPVADLVSVDVIQGKATYLADLKPLKAESTGFLGAAWKWTANQSVRGEPLRLVIAEGESTYDRGIGTHPRTTLTYGLGGKYRRFEALVGLDAATGTRGRASIRILVDGKEQPLPKLLKLATGPAIPVDVNVMDAKQLILIVDFGPAADVQADVDWADARVVE